MKPIKITTKQKKKLLEMCNKLFPENDMNFGHGFMEDYIQVKVDSESLDEEWIHWFEFCLTHLSNKLPVRVLHIHCTFGGRYQTEHLVDYLYGLFKELNLKNK